MPLYVVKLENIETGKRNTVTFGAPCLQEAKTEAKKLENKSTEIVGVERIDAIKEEESWAEHTSRKF